jgi:hypothetical protein
MAAHAPPLEFSRVLVALAAAAPNRAALETGIRLAAAVGARLEGLFVEDTNLVRLAALPFASELSALTAAHRTLPPADIERAFRVEAAHLERLLAQSATRARIEWSFQVTRGHLLVEVVARSADLTVLDAARRVTGPIRNHEAPPRARGPAHSVTALFDASPAAWRGLVAATRLAQALERELLILLPQGDAATAAAAGKQARDWLASERLAGLVLAVPAIAEALVTTVRTRRSTLLVLPTAALPVLGIDLGTLAAGMPCPLVVVR